MKKTLLFLTILFISFLGYSQTFTVNNITYSVTSTSPNKVAVTNYNTAGGVNVVIPSSVIPNSSSKSSSNKTSNNTTYSVTSIEDQAFHAKSLESVSIPSTVTKIGISAFLNNKLEQITLPNNITEIKASAFRNNPSLTCVTSLNTTPPSISSSSTTGSFENRHNINLIVPSGSLSTYISASGGWSGFNNNGDPLEVNDTFWDGFFQYKIISTTNNTVSVNGYNTAGGSSITIPEIVSDCTNNYTVIEVGANAFQGDNITSVSIPNTVTIIRQNGFASTNLTSIILPNSITSIEQGAFHNSTLGGTVKIPEGTTTIGNYAFRGTVLSTLTLPSTLTSIGSTAFANISNLTKVFSYATTPPTIVTGGSNDDTFGSTRSNIHLYIPVGTSGAYTTDSGALWTGFNPVSEFFIDSHITYEVTSSSPSTVKIIDYNTDGGTSITIPNTITKASVSYAVKRIEDTAFYGNNLGSVTIVDGIETIGKQAFKNNNLQTIVIPNSVTDIDEFAFENNALQTVTLSSSLSEVKRSVFQNNMINTLAIPNNIVFIRPDAFENNQLTSLTIPGSINIIYQQAFRNNLLTNLTIEDGVHLIYYAAFESNQLSSLTIPASVSFLGNACFQNNPLTDITSIRTTAPDINTDATWDTFIADRSGIDLTIPTGSMDSYVTGTNAEWTGFNSVTEDSSLSKENLELNKLINIAFKANSIKVKTSSSIELKRYTIYSITGSVIKNGKEKSIDTSLLTSGVYILKLNFNKGVITKKFLK